MSTWDDRTLLEDVLANGVDDWVDEALICGNIARRVTPDPPDRRAIAIGLIAAVLFGGLMEAGDTPIGKGFVPWDAEPGQAMQRITEAWMAYADPDVRPGSIVWLRNTSKGDAIGRAVLERESG